MQAYKHYYYVLMSYNWIIKNLISLFEPDHHLYKLPHVFDNFFYIFTLRPAAGRKAENEEFSLVRDECVSFYVYLLGSTSRCLLAFFLAAIQRRWISLICAFHL